MCYLKQGYINLVLSLAFNFPERAVRRVMHFAE